MKIHEMEVEEEEVFEGDDVEGVGVDNGATLEIRHTDALELLKECGRLLDDIVDLDIGKPFTWILRRELSDLSDGIYDFLQEEEGIVYEYEDEEDGV